MRHPRIIEARSSPRTPVIYEIVCRPAKKKWIAAATPVGSVLNFTPLAPMKALFWSAVIDVAEVCRS